MGAYYNYDASGERNLKLTGGTVNVTGEPVFFYHSDHLGSASYITDDHGYETQHLVYLPFGELRSNRAYLNVKNNNYNEQHWVDWKYNTSQFETSYKFNGKEKDEESGYNYYGARFYYDYLSIFLSVDPLSDKYPHLTSYAYCANNPIMLIDPDGRKITPASRSIWYGNKMSAAMVFSRALKNYQTNGSNLKELAGSAAVLLTMTYMESSSQTYNVNNSGLNRSQYNSETGAIDINVNLEGTFFNEIAHGAQYETNNLGYNKKGGGEAYDINDEREAFQLQSILVPQSIPDELKDKNGNIKITNDNIRNIKKDVNGTPTFPYNRKEVPDENLNGDSCNGEKRYCDPNGGLKFKDMHE